MPPMVGGVFYEHGHRMAATLVGFLTLVLAIWTARAEPRPGVRRLAWAALAAVIAQGLLGGLTVIYLLPTPVSVTHACLAQLFFCATIALATVTSREWLDAAARATTTPACAPRGAGGDGGGLRPAPAGRGDAPHRRRPRHPRLPARLRPLVPPLDVRAGGRPLRAPRGRGAGRPRRSCCAWRPRPSARRDARFRASRRRRCWRWSRRRWRSGAATVLTGKAVTPTTAHVATGAAVLGACWWIALRARRLLRRPPAEAGAPPSASRSRWPREHLHALAGPRSRRRLRRADQAAHHPHGDAHRARRAS